MDIYSGGAGCRCETDPLSRHDDIVRALQQLVQAVKTECRTLKPASELADAVHFSEYVLKRCGLPDVPAVSQECHHAR